MDQARWVEAIRSALERAPPRGFLESVEVAINLQNVDLTQPKNRLDEEVPLPKGRGKPIHVAVFAGGELAVRSRPVADLVIAPEEITDLSNDKRRARKIASSMNFFLAEAPLMPTVGRTLGSILGPRGKMPRPIPPTADPVPLIQQLRTTVRIRSRDRRTFHAPIGTRSMAPEDLAENALAIFDRVVKKMERGTQNIHSVYVKTTMGPSIRVEVA